MTAPRWENACVEPVGGGSVDGGSVDGGSVDGSSVDGGDERVRRAAVALLATSVPASCAGLVAYHAAGYDAYLAAALRPPPAMRTVVLRVVRVSGEVAAVADWRLLPERLFLNGIAVRDAYQGRGLGGRLLRDGLGIARDLGGLGLARDLGGLGIARDLERSTVELDVAVGNQRAVSLYQRAGFVPIGYAVWRDVPAGGDEQAGGSVKVLDWPAFDAHHSAFGFGDLAVRDGTGMVHRVRVIGDALRLPAGEHAASVARALRDVLPISRVFSTQPTSSVPDHDGFASFARMRLSLAYTAQLGY